MTDTTGRFDLDNPGTPAATALAEAKPRLDKQIEAAEDTIREQAQTMTIEALRREVESVSGRPLRRPSSKDDWMDLYVAVRVSRLDLVKEEDRLDAAANAEIRPMRALNTMMDAADAARAGLVKLADSPLELDTATLYAAHVRIYQGMLASKVYTSVTERGVALDVAVQRAILHAMKMVFRGINANGTVAAEVVGANRFRDQMLMEIDRYDISSFDLA